MFRAFKVEWEKNTVYSNKLSFRKIINSRKQYTFLLVLQADCGNFFPVNNFLKNLVKAEMCWLTSYFLEESRAG